MSLAFTWWAVLLHKKNNTIFQLKQEFAATQPDTDTLTHWAAIEQEHQNRMIIGEGIVFVITLLTGFWIIHRSYRHELSVSQQQSNFLLSVTHELKSPLTAVSLIFQTLANPRFDESKRKLIIEQGQKEIARLNGLIEQLLLSAKLDYAFHPHLSSHFLLDLVKEAIDWNQTQFPELEIEIKGGQGIQIMADRNSMVSVFSNIIENACKYSQHRKKVDITISESDDQILVDFRDYGIGIPYKLAKKVFKKFYRIGSEETRNTKGTGLGLYIANEVVKAHQGKVQILSPKEGGTTIRISICKKKGI